MAISAMAQSLGVLWLVWGGQRIDVEEKSTSFNRGGRVAQSVQAGVRVTQGYKYVPSKVKAKFPLLNGMSLDELTALNGSEMQVHCDSGQVYIISSAVIQGDPQTTGAPGSNVTMEWGGEYAVEVIS